MRSQLEIATRFLLSGQAAKGFADLAELVVKVGSAGSQEENHCTDGAIELKVRHGIFRVGDES